MATAHLIVRATLADPADRQKFDHWYQTEHLPDAVKGFKARRAWRSCSKKSPLVYIACLRAMAWPGTDEAFRNLWLDAPC